MKNYLLILTMSLPFFQETVVKFFDIKPDTPTIVTQKNEIEHLLKDWIISKGHFESDQLAFEVKNMDKHTYGMYQVYTFGKEGKITFNYFNPSEIMICGVGLMNITEGTWELNDANELTIHLKGQHFAENSFEYKIKYSIEQLTDENLLLKEEDRMISEIKSLY